ncbi:hypothetical protein [Micromonospora sp. NBC_00421]|uniref:hypothetical protein n=1 Tax=Micromonospora sp. NBC_00421 TaxID=2975976 RepID=UPI002E1AB620
MLERIRRYFTEHSTVGVIGRAGVEAGLSRLCLLLARFEAGLVPGQGAIDGSIYRNILTVEGIHRSVPDDEVHELAGLVAKLPSALGDLLAEASSSLGVADPVFVADCAEGDLVIGDTLVSVSLGGRSDMADRLRRLVAYAWLDIADVYRIRRLGIYLASSGTLMTWPVADLASLLLSGADPDTARAEYRALTVPASEAHRPVVLANATVEHRRDCVIVATSMPARAGGESAGTVERPGWKVTPNGPTCPDRNLAELASPFCVGLPDGWRLDYIESTEPARAGWEVVKQNGYKVYRSSPADADSLALVSFVAAGKPLAMPGKRPTQAQPCGFTAYGPEVWDTVGGTDWICWDLWLCVLCVADHGGDWDRLDAAVTHRISDRAFGEALWCQILDLRRRLDASGLSAAELVGDLVRHRKTLAKARAKVVEHTGVNDKHLSPAMRDLPSERFLHRARFGAWNRYPVSPQPYYQQLVAAAPFDVEDSAWEYRDIDPILQELAMLDAGNSDDPRRLLAVRRAGLTIASLLPRACNDSYGDVGEAISEIVLRFSHLDWRASGIDPAIFWRDVLEIFTDIDNFALTPDREIELMTNLGAHLDRAILDQTVEDLHASYIADRLSWNAETVMRWRQFASASTQ